TDRRRPRPAARGRPAPRARGGGRARLLRGAVVVGDRGARRHPGRDREVADGARAGHAQGAARAARGGRRAMRADIAELLPEFVLGTLPDAEAREVQAALAGSPALRQELDRVTEALAAATLALDPVSPSQATRQRLMSTL